jgi:hypothetical protein
MRFRKETTFDIRCLTSYFFMTCEETQQAFSLYVDDALTPLSRADCDAHLQQCPVCREHLAQTRLLIRRLAMLTQPVPPTDLIPTISDALAIEAGARARQPRLTHTERIQLWLEPRLMPYTIGAFASLLLFVMMLSALRPQLQLLREAADASRLEDATVYRTFVPRNSAATDELDITQPVSSIDYAAQRAPYAVESPSINPTGALAALTRSTEHGHSSDDDMVVVTDVYSSGRASLADVVQPPRDRRMLDEFQNALRQDAAFVPASFDRRPQTMRVVFVVQKVNVREGKF